MGKTYPGRETEDFRSDPMKISDLEFVAKDNGQSAWYYNPNDACYYRFYSDGSRKAISGHNLPNPELLWQSRINAMLVHGGRVDVNSLKPSPATFALWEHHKRYLQSSKTMA